MKKKTTKINYLNVGDKTIPYIILNKNNKNTYFRFKKDYLEVSKSKYVNENYVITYLTNNFDEFYNKYLKTIKTIPKTDEIVLEEKSYQLKIIASNTFNYEITDNKLIVYTKLTDNLKIKKLIYKKHLIKMLERIDKKVTETLIGHKIKPLKIRFGHYKSKFGSYHRIKDEITLNVVLAKANIGYLYYVLMHEYAHTKHFDHSKNFYKVLKELMPEYDYYHKTIKKLSIWI